MIGDSKPGKYANKVARGPAVSTSSGTFCRHSITDSMFFSRILRQAAHGHGPVVWVWHEAPSDGIVAKAIPTALAATGVGSVVFAIYSLLLTEPGQ